MSPGRMDTDRLVTAYLDGTASDSERASIELRCAHDRDFARQLELAEGSRRLLREDAEPDLPPGFLARIQARSRFTGSPRPKPPRWAHAAGLLAIVGCIAAAYWTGLEDGRSERRSEATRELNEPVALTPPLARAARLTLSDVATSDLIPESVRRPLVASQLEAFGLKEWSQHDEGRAARFFRRLERELQRSRVPWEPLRREARDSSLWREVQRRESAPSGLAVAPSMARDEVFEHLVRAHAKDLDPTQRDSVVELMRLKREFIAGRSETVLHDPERLHAWLVNESERSAFAAPVSHMVALGLSEHGYPKEAVDFLTSWWPESRFPHHQGFLRRLPFALLDPRGSGEEDAWARPGVDRGSSASGDAAGRRISVIIRRGR